jgi:hypothetical protein
MPGSTAGRQPATQNLADLVARVMASDSRRAVVEVFMVRSKVIPA